MRHILSVIVILIGIFFIGGLLIPSEWTVSRSTTIHALPEQIYPYISDFKKWEDWAPWNRAKDPSLTYTYSGTPAGIGAKQSWTSEKMGTGWMQLTAADPKTGVSYDLFIEMNGMQSTVHGNINMAIADGYTRVTWTDQGTSNKSLIKRWMSLALRVMLGKDIETGLSNLKNLVEKN